MAEQQKPTDEQAVQFIAAALLIGASAEATSKTLAPMLAVPAAVLRPILLLALAKALVAPSSGAKTATRLSDEEEATFRAGWAWAATQRILAGGTMKDEQKFFNQHLDAARNRHQRAAEVDKAAKRYGATLGWHAKMDSITSEECREANGRNFNINRVPEIGFPGTVHRHCRCKPGRPFATSKSVYDVKIHRRAA